MSWWKQSISSNVDICGINSQRNITFEHLSEEVIYLTSHGNSHTEDAFAFFKDHAPGVKLTVVNISNRNNIITELSQLAQYHDKIVFGQWHLTEPNPELDELFADLARSNELVFLFSAGNKNIPIEKLSPLNSSGVLTIGSYNRSGTISEFCDKVSCDLYFPGTSIRINDDLKYGTSYAVLVAVMAFLEVKHKGLDISEQIIETNGVKRLITTQTYRKKTIPAHVSPSNICKIESGADGIVMYIDDTGEAVDPNMPLIDAYGEVLRNIDHPITIPMSGGIDSEAIAQAAIKHNVPFNAVTMRYIYDGRCFNEHDYRYATSFCQANNIQHRFIDLNCNWFYEEENYLHYVTHYFSESPQLCAHLWMFDQLSDFVIFPGDVPVVLENGKLTLPPFQYFSYDYLAHSQNKKSITHMLMHTKQILVSALKLSQKRKTNSSDKHTSKCLFYEGGGFEVDWCRVKQTGFEHLKKHISDKYKEEHTQRTFDAFYRANNGRMFLPDTINNIRVKYSNEYN